MQISTLLLSAISIGSAFAQSSTASAMSAQTTVHVVRVSSSNNTLQYFPNTVTAAVGDMVQFQFAAGNHTVTQSTFAQPCQPIALNSNVTGFFSGFMPVASGGGTSTPTYTIVVNNTTPIWVYCSQAMHCQKGMTMVINENLATNKTLAAYNALAAQATSNLPGNTPEGGSSSSTIIGGSTATASVANGGASSTSTAGTAKSTSSPGEALRPSVGMGMAALAGLFALFI